MPESVLNPEMTEDQYKFAIADIMARIEDSNEESLRSRAEIDNLKAQSRALMNSIESALRRLESRSS